MRMLWFSVGVTGREKIRNGNFRGSWKWTCLDRMSDSQGGNCTVMSNMIHVQTSIQSSSSSLGSHCVPWLGEGLSMSSPDDPVLCCPLPYRVAPVFVQVVSPPLGWSPFSSFLIMVSKWWRARSIGRLWGGWYALPRTISFFSQCRLYLWDLSSPWPRCLSFYLCVWCWAYFFPFWFVRPHVCSVLVWSVSRSLHHMS